MPKGLRVRLPPQTPYASVAQWQEAFDLGSKQWGFESLLKHQCRDDAIGRHNRFRVCFTKSSSLFLDTSGEVLKWFKRAALNTDRSVAWQAHGFKSHPLRQWKSGWVVEGAGLEYQWANYSAGSNPVSSAMGMWCNWQTRRSQKPPSMSSNLIVPTNMGKWCNWQTLWF